MFTQFFGSYLLNKKIVSAQNLKEAMEKKGSTTLKLGILSINAGYMTSAQVDEICGLSENESEFAAKSIERGYITPAQVDELSNVAGTGCLYLGQALVDMGCLSEVEFEQALNNYKEEHDLTDEDFSEENNEKAANVISSFYNLDGNYKDYVSEYINILFKNLIRFVGDDFTPLPSATIAEDLTAAVQEIFGEFMAVTSIIVDDKAAIEFASRYSEEELEENDQYTKDVVSEFLNLHNGLFNVNISNSTGKELGLTPQEVMTSTDVLKIKSKLFLTVPVQFSFGTVIILIAVL